jgi:hypothetical protein
VARKPGRTRGASRKARSAVPKGLAELMLLAVIEGLLAPRKPATAPASLFAIMRRLKVA